MGFLRECYMMLVCRHKIVLWQNVFRSDFLEKELNTDGIDFWVWRSHFDPVEPWRGKIKATFYFRKVEDALLFKLIFR